MANIAPNTGLQVEVTTKQILKIALPITLAMLVPQINFVANTAFLGGLGVTELGSAGVTGVYYLVFALVGNGLNSGLQALIARRAGENQPGEIGKMFAQSIWITLIFAAFGIAISYLMAPWFLSNALSSQEVQSEAIEFIKIRVWGLPFLYVFQMGNALLVGTNNSKYMKYAFIVEASLNIILDYGLIYGKLGMPEIGFNGAAIASIIAEVSAAVIVFSIILYKRFHTRFSIFAHTRFDKRIAGLLFRQSSPLVLQYVLSIGAWLFFYILIEHRGELPLAISNTMRNIFAIGGVFIWAFASTSNAMVSNIIGQGRKEEVRFLIGRIARLSFLFTAGFCLVINLIPGIFLRLYGQDAAFIQEAIPVLRMVTAGMLLMSISTIWLNGVTGTANTRINLAIEIIASIAYGIYVYLILAVWKLSVVWAWSSEFLYWGIILALAWLYLRGESWKKKVI